MKTNGSDGIFPEVNSSYAEEDPLHHPDQGYTHVYFEGNPLTKREYFAGLAIQGLLADPDVMKGKGVTPKTLPSIAVQYADGLIKAFNEEEETK